MNWFICNKENHWLEGEECRPATTFTTRQTKPPHDIRVLCDYIPFVEASRTLPVDFRTSRFRDPVRTGFRRVNQSMLRPNICDAIRGGFFFFVLLSRKTTRIGGIIVRSDVRRSTRSFRCTRCDSKRCLSRTRAAMTSRDASRPGGKSVIILIF